MFQTLTTPNPGVDRSHLQRGPNSFSVGDYEVEGVQVWEDFTFTNVMKCFGDILSEEVSSDILHQPAPIYPHHLRLIDESSFLNALH